MCGSLEQRGARVGYFWHHHRSGVSARKSPPKSQQHQRELDLPERQANVEVERFRARLVLRRSKQRKSKANIRVPTQGHNNARRRGRISF